MNNTQILEYKTKSAKPQTVALQLPNCSQSMGEQTLYKNILKRWLKELPFSPAVEKSELGDQGIPSIQSLVEAGSWSSLKGLIPCIPKI